MKLIRQLLLITSGVVSFVNSNAQTTTDIIIDMATNSYTLPLPTATQLKPQNFIRLRLDNFDWTGKYTVSINKKDSVITIPEPPQLFKVLFLGQDFTNLLAGLTDFTSKVPSLTKEDSSTLKNNLLQDIFDDSPSEMLATSTDVAGFKSMVESFSKEKKKEEPVFNVKFKKIIQIIANYAAGSRDAPLRADVNAQPLAWSQVAPELLKYSDYFNDPEVTKVLLQLTPEELKKSKTNAAVATALPIFLTTHKANIIAQHLSFETTVLQPTLVNFYNLGKNTITAAAFEAAATGHLALRQAQVNAFDVLFQSYLDYSVPLSGLISADKSLQRADSLILNYRKGFYDFLKKFDSLFNYSTILATYKAASLYTTTYTSWPFQITKDMTQLDISVTPNDNNKNLPAYSTSIMLPYRSEKYWMFTTGFYINNLSDEKYNNKIKLINNNADTVYNVVKEDDSKLSFGAAALLHFGKYFKDSDVGYHVAFGPGISIEKKPVPRLLFGAGLSFGKQSKVAITFGGVIGFVDRFSNAYDFTTNYSKPETNVTYEKVRGSWFLSLGYSIFGK